MAKAPTPPDPEVSDDPVTRPLLGPGDQVSFLDSHAPAIGAGDYRVQITQQVDELELTATRSLDFAVAGPRFSLPQAEIASRFPPPGASGDFGTVLPHVILKRSTLPWERSAIHGDENEVAHPWLALMVFPDGYLNGKTSVVEAATLLAAQVDTAPVTAPGASARQLLRERADDPGAKVSVLDIPADDARRMLPALDELRLLSTARHVAGRPARAVAVSSQLPVVGVRNTVHLVSLEHQFTPQGAHWAADQSTRTLRFVSLTSWSFTCTAQRGDLGHIFANLTNAAGVLAPDRDGAGADMAARGYVPLANTLRDGTRTASWYRGPLTFEQDTPPAQLPVRRAEDLLAHDAPTAMYDISHAAAWKLGQMLALANQDVAQNIVQWKRAQAHREQAERQAMLHPEHAAAPPEQAGFPATAWFDSALGELREVPFCYLVPEPDLIPRESVFGFRLDRAWMQALYDGAFSLGRTSAQELIRDAAHRAHLPPQKAQGGVIIRSAAVAGWPELELTALAGIGATGTPKILRFDRVAPDVLLVLFDQPLDSVTLHLHPQAIHWGLDGAQGGLAKGATPVAVADAHPRRVDIAGLAKALGTAAPHEFAFAMIEKAPQATFYFEEGLG